MSLHTRILKNIPIFFLIFFACFFIDNVDALRNADFRNSEKVTIDKNFFRKKADTSYLKFETNYYNQKTSKAIDYLKQAIFYAPNSVHLKIRLAEIYAAENLYAEAAHQYQQIIAKNPKPEFIEAMADIYALRGLETEALKQYRLLSKMKPQFSYLLKTSILLIETKKWTQALKSLELAKKYAVTDDEKGQVLLSKAYTYAQLENKAGQNRAAKAISKLQIDSEELILKIAHFYFATDQQLLAASLLSSFQDREESSVQIAKQLFKIYLYLEKNDQAYKQANHLKDLGSLDSNHYLFAISFLLENHKYDQALPFIRDFANLKSSEDYYQYLLANVYHKNNQLSQSLSEYKKIKRESPYFLPSQIEVAHILKEQKKIKKAIYHLGKLYSLKDLDKDAHLYLVYAQYLWDEDYQKKSLKVLAEATQAFPAHTDLHFLRGIYLSKLGDADQALKDVHYVLSLDDSHAEALNLAAYIYAEKGEKLDEAKDLAGKALSIQPNSSYFLDTMGWLHFKKKDYKKALSYFNRALKHNSQDIQLLKHIADLYYELKNFEKCEYFLKQALKLEDNDKQRSKIKRRLASLQAHL